MKPKFVDIVRIVSIFLGMGDALGIIWFVDHFMSETFHIIFFELSTVLSLLVLPLLTNRVLRNVYVRLVGMLIGLSGIIGALYRIKESLTLPNYPDIPAIICRAASVIVLVIMIRRTLGKSDRGQS